MFVSSQILNSEESSLLHLSLHYYLTSACYLAVIVTTLVTIGNSREHSCYFSGKSDEGV